MKLNSVLNGDCLELLQSIPDNSVDITFADPPFNLNKKYNSYRDQKGLQDYIEWCEIWLTQMVRVTKPSGSIFVHNIPRWLTYYSSILNKLADFRHWIAWDAMGAPLGKGLLPNHYGILYYAKDIKLNKFYDLRYPHHRCRKCSALQKDYGGKKASLHPFGPLVSDVWVDLHRIRHAKRRDEHPCQLPIPLLERIVLMTTDEGDIVLDPFAGTGTSLVAAKRLGRNYVGIELDPVYVEITNENLEKFAENSKIGESWVSIYLDQIVTIQDRDWDNLKEHFVIPTPIQEIEYQRIKYKNGKVASNQASKSSRKNAEKEFVQLSYTDDMGY